MNTPGDIWKMVLSLLEKRLQPVTLDAWFDDLTAVEFKDDTLLLHTPDKFKKEIITKEQFEIEHQKNFIELAGHLVDAGVILKEVFWNGRPQKQRDVATNNE